MSKTHLQHTENQQPGTHTQHSKIRKLRTQTSQWIPSILLSEEQSQVSTSRFSSEKPSIQSRKRQSSKHSISIPTTLRYNIHGYQNKSPALLFIAFVSPNSNSHSLQLDAKPKCTFTSYYFEIYILFLLFPKSTFTKRQIYFIKISIKHNVASKSDKVHYIMKSTYSSLGVQYE